MVPFVFITMFLLSLAVLTMIVLHFTEKVEINHGVLKGVSFGYLVLMAPLIFVVFSILVSV